MQYINDLYSNTQWKKDLHKHYELYDGLEVALEVECPIELVDHREEWEWHCSHFQDEKYLKKVKANSINRPKKKLLHRSGSRHFFYRLEEQRKGESKFPEIDMFKEVYVWLGDELMKQLHSTMVEKGQTILEEVVSQLPLETPIEEGFPVRMLGFRSRQTYLIRPSVVGKGMFTKGLGKLTFGTRLPHPPSRELKRSKC